jgi:prepilin-type N-terminal cleavage/methylation domain-containing protein
MPVSESLDFKHHRGFTIIEILVVISIIGLLSTLAIVALRDAQERGRDTRRKADLEQTKKAMIFYANDHGGVLPTTDFGWNNTGGGWATNNNNGSWCYSYGTLENFLDGTDPDIPAPANLYIKMPHDPKCGGCGGCGSNPGGYMYYFQNTSCGVLFAHLDNPSAADTATCTGKCVALSTLGTNYGMNYCVEVRP